MKNQLSMPSSSSSPHKHDQQLKSAVLAVEEKETMNNPHKYHNKIYICYLCKGAFLTPHALGGHRTTHKEDREVERQQKNHEFDHSLQENGSGSTHSKSLISKGKNKVDVVAEDYDNKDIGRLTKKKRS